MAGFRIIERDREVLVPVFNVNPEEVPTYFLTVVNGASALVHPEHIGYLLDEVARGDLDLRDAWDHLLVKTPGMDYPQPCEVVTSTVDGETPIHFKVNGQVVYRMKV